VTAGSNTLRPFKRHPRLADFGLAAQDGEAFGHNVAEIKSICDSLRGRRNVSLPADAVAMLRAHKVAQLELRLQLGQGGQPTLVFSTIEGEFLSPEKGAASSQGSDEPSPSDPA
jgi:hypothetical protein